MSVALAQAPPEQRPGETRGHYMPSPPQGAPGSSSHPPGWLYSSPSPFRPSWLCHPHSSNPAGPSPTTPLSGSSSPHPLCPSWSFLPHPSIQPVLLPHPSIHRPFPIHPFIQPALLPSASPSQRVLPPLTLLSQLALSPSTPLSWPAFTSFQPRFLE